MTQKLVDYFKVSLQTDLKPLSFTNYEKSSGVERELFRQSVREANYVFAGPGSPSYALAQWKGLDLQEDLLHVLDNGGVVCFSSAAALTLGAFTAPIYEIYKAGAEPHWLEGLNLMGLLGINCAVIPHFNNNEGQDYDTSCCYLGVERLEKLESNLPMGVATLGIEEHTALTINLEDQTQATTGKGNVYLRFNGTSKTIKTSSDFRSSELKVTIAKSQQNTEIKNILIQTSPMELAKMIEMGGEKMLSALAKLVMLASDTKKESVDLSPLIESLLEIRSDLKAENNYFLADKLRHALSGSGIAINDTSDGVKWTIKN
jgi:peptidase E